MKNWIKSEDRLRYLGFNDIAFTLICIPLLSILIPIAFFRNNWLTTSIPFSEDVFEALIYTCVLWYGNRSFILFIRRRYEGFKKTHIRAILQTIFLLTYGFVVVIVLGSVMKYCSIGAEVTNLEGFIASYFTSAFVLAIYEGLYLYDQNKKIFMEQEKLKREHIHSELQGLRSQVNPHFLFNSMNTLMNIIEEDQALATSFLNKLSHVYRYILEKRDDHLIPLKEELKFIESYVFLQKERFKNNLKVELSIEHKYLDKLILPLSLQMLFENAIKHNIISRKKPLQIEVFVEDNYLVIKNNLQLKMQAMPSTGVGLENIKSRFQFFTKQTVEIEETADHFAVKIPLLSQADNKLINN